MDGLHQRAGNAAVLELHGSLLRARCVAGCAERVPWPAGHDAPPPCPRCGAPLRPDVVWFGEALPEEPLAAAWKAAEHCDVLLSIGTSNLVQPAASLPWIAARTGAFVIVVNPVAEGQQTGRNIRPLIGAAGQVLPDLLERSFGRRSAVSG